MLLLRQFKVHKVPSVYNIAFQRSNTDTAYFNIRKKKVEVLFPKSLNVQKWSKKEKSRKFTGQKVALCCWIQCKRIKSRLF